MLQQYASTWLTEYFKKYVRMGDHQKLQLSLWSGELNLTNLELNPETLVPSGLPVVCERGYVGGLKVRIPWTRLQSEPVSITLEKVSILLRPKKGSKWNKESHEREQREAKDAALSAFEKTRQSNLEETKDAGKKVGFFSRFQDVISSNIQITINDVHIRYEDPDIHPHNPVALGVHFSTLSCVSTDENWVPGFITHQQLLHKLLSLEDLQVYISPILSNQELMLNSFAAGPPLQEDEKDEFYSVMKSFTKCNGYRVLDPLGLYLRLRLQKGGQLNHNLPRVSSNVRIQPMKLCLTRFQYEVILNTCGYFHKFSEVDKFRRLRPSSRVAGNAPSWWKFAINSVLLLIQERRQRRKYDPEETRMFKKRGEEYANLWKRDQGVPWLPVLTPVENARLEQLHKDMVLHHIIWWREVAYAELKVDQRQYSAQLKLKDQAIGGGSTQGKGSGWVGALNPLGYLPSWRAQSEEPSVSDLTSTWTDDERKKLSAMGIIESSSLSIQSSKAPDGYIDHTLSIVLELAQVQLFAEDDQVLGELRIKDTQFRNGSHDSFKLSIGDCTVGTGGSSFVSKKVTNRSEPLLAASVSGSSVSVALTPLDLLLDKDFAVAIIRFFKLPPQIDLSLPSTIRDLATGQLRDMIQPGPTVTFKFSSDSSTIVIPFLATHSDKNLPSSFGVSSSRGPDCNYMIPAVDGGVIFSLESMCISSVDVDPSQNSGQVEKYTLQCRQISTKIFASLSSPPEPLINPFDVSLMISRALKSPQHMPAADIPELHVDGRISQVHVHFSRQNLLILAYVLDLLTKISASLSPEIPNSLMVTQFAGTVRERYSVALDLDDFIYDQMGLCQLQHRQKDVAETYFGVVIIHNGTLLSYAKLDEGSVLNPELNVVLGNYHLRAIYNLRDSPFRITHRESETGDEIELELPQAFGPGKKLHLANFVSFDPKVTARGILNSLTLLRDRLIRDCENPAVGVTRSPETPKISLQFQLKKLTVDVLGVDNTDLVSTMNFDNFKANVVRRVHALSVDLSLGSLRCADGTGSAFAFTPETSEDVPLVTLGYLACVEQSAFWKTEGPDMQVRLSAQTLNLVLTPALVSLGEVFYDCLGVNRIASSTAVPVHYAAPYLFQPSRGSSLVMKDPIRVDTNIAANMHCLKVTCLDEIGESVYKEFLELSMCDAVFCVKLSEAATQVEGKLGNLQVDEIDFDTGTRTSLCGIASDSAGQNLTEFLYVSPNGQSRASDTAMVTGSVTAVLRHIRSTFHTSILQHVLFWGTSGTIVRSLQSITTRTVFTGPSDGNLDQSSFISFAADQTNSFGSIPVSVDDDVGRKISMVEVSLRLVNPVVSLPGEKLTTSPKDYLLADLGNVTVTTRLRKTESGIPISQVDLMFEDVAISSSEGKIASELSLKMSTKQLLMTPADGSDPLSSMDVQVGNVRLFLSEEQWGHSMRVVAFNLLDSYTPQYIPVGLDPQPNLSASTVSVKTIGAGSLSLELQQSLVMNFDKIGVVMKEESDSSGSTQVSVQQFSMNTVGACRPLVNFVHQSGPALAATMSTKKDLPSRVAINLGHPTVYLDPDMLLLAQDTLACEGALSAVNHILKKSTEVKLPKSPLQTDNSTTYTAEMVSLTLFGLQFGSTSPLFKAKASSTKIECSAGGDSGNITLRASLGDAHLYDVTQEEDERDVFGLPSMTDNSNSLLEIFYNKDVSPGIEKKTTTKAEVTLQNLRVVIVSSFWARMAAWADPVSGQLSKLKTLGVLQSERLNPLSTDSLHDSHVIINWNGPHLVLPLLSDPSRFLTFTLGHLSLTQSGLEGTNIALTNVRVHHTGCAVGIQNNLNIDIVRDFDVRINLTPTGQELSAEVGTITVQMTDAQVQFLTLIMLQQLANIPENPQPPTGIEPSDQQATVSQHSFVVSVSFDGLQLLIDKAGELENCPLSELNMMNVVATYKTEKGSQAISRLTMGSLSVIDKGGVSDKMIVTTQESRDVDDQPQLPCLDIQISQDWVLGLRCVHISVHPLYIIKMIQFSESCQVGSGVVSGVTTPSVSPRRAVRSKFSASLDQLTIAFYPKKTLVATVELAGGEVCHSTTPEGIATTTGLISTLRLFDSGSTSIIKPTFTPAPDTIFEFCHTSHPAPVNGFDKHLTATMKSLSAFYAKDFISLVTESLGDVHVQKLLNWNEAATKADVSQADTTVSTGKHIPCLLHMVVENPIINIPDGCNKENQGVSIDFGRIELTSEDENPFEIITLQLTNFDLAVATPTTRVSKVISCSHLMVKFKATWSGGNNEESNMRETHREIWITCQPVNFILSRDNWLQVLKVAKPFYQSEAANTTNPSNVAAAGPSVPEGVATASVPLSVNFTLPKLSLLLQNARADPFVMLTLSGIDSTLTHYPNTESCMELCVASVGMNQVWCQGSQLMGRGLLYAPATAQTAKVLSTSLKWSQKINTSFTQAVFHVRLPSLLFIPSLIRDFSDTLLGPYQTVFLEGTQSSTVEEIVVEESLVLNEDLFLSPHKVLRFVNKKKNCIEVDGQSTTTIHLVREPGCSDHCIQIDDGMTIRLKNVILRTYTTSYGRGVLDDHCSLGDGSYLCTDSGTQIINDVREKAVQNFPQDPTRPHHPTPITSLKRNIDIRFDQSCFGIGISGNVSQRPQALEKPQRCVLLMASLKEAKYQSESVLRDEATVTYELEFENISAVHVPIQAPVHLSDIHAHVPAASPVAVDDVASILDSTTAEVLFSDTGKGKSRRAQVVVPHIRGSLCLGDTRLVSEFCESLTVFTKTSKSKPRKTTTDTPTNVGVNVGEMQIRVADDETGTPIPVAELYLKGVAASCGFGGENDYIDALASPSISYYNNDICMWEPFVESFDVELKSKQSDITNVIELSSTKALINVTPALVTSALRTSELLSLIGTKPLKKQHAFTLFNCCGRDIFIYTGCAENPRPIEVPVDSHVEFDSSSKTVFIAIILNRSRMQELPLPCAEGDSSECWESVPIVTPGKFGVGEGHIVEIENKNGKKLVTYRTNVVIQNELSISMHVENVGVVRGGSSLSVPYDVSMKDHCFVIRPLAGRYQPATLGYLFCNLADLPKKWCNYVARCPSLSEGIPDMCVMCSIETDNIPSKTHIRDVTVKVRPLLRIINQLPIELNVTVSVENKLISGKIKSHGGNLEITQAGNNWPNCSVKMSAGCVVGNAHVQTVHESLIFDTDPGERSSYVSMMERGSDYQFCPQIAYAKNDNYILAIFSPVWVRNHTEYSFQMFAADTLSGTTVPGVQKNDGPCPIAPSAPPGSDSRSGIRRMFLQFKESSNPVVPLPLTPTAMSGSCSVKLQHPKIEMLDCHIGCNLDSIHWSDNGFQYTTQVVNLVPRWVFHNKTSSEISIRVVLPAGTRPAFAIRAKESRQCCSSSRRHESQIEVRYTSDISSNTRFSRPFSINQEQSLDLRLNFEPRSPDNFIPTPGVFKGNTAPDRSAEYFNVLRVSTQEINGCMNVTFTECKKPPYVLENRTRYPMCFWHKDLQPSFKRTLPPATSVPYSPDNPLASSQLSFSIFSQADRWLKDVVVRLDKPAGERQKIVLGYGATPVWIRIRHSESALVSILSITEEHYLAGRGTDRPITSIVNMSLSGIGISFSLPKRNRDIILITLSSIMMKLKPETESHFALLIGDIQIDDVSKKDVTYPVLVHRRIERSQQAVQTDPAPFFLLEFLQDYQSAEVIIARLFEVRLTPMKVSVTDDVISLLLMFYLDVCSAVEATDTTSWRNFTYITPSSVDSSSSRPLLSKRVLVNDITIYPIELLISLTRTGTETDVLSHVREHFWWLSYLITIDNTSLNWDQCHYPDINEPLGIIMQRIAAIYRNRLFSYSHLGKIASSVGFIGNPGALLKGVTQGFSDLVSHSYNDMSVAGVTKGAKSLFGNMGTGIAESLTSFTKTASRNVGSFGVLDAFSNGLEWYTGVSLTAYERLRGPREFKSPGVLILSTERKEIESQPENTDGGMAESVQQCKRLIQKGVPTDEIKKQFPMKVIALSTSWDQFRSMCSVSEFYEFANLARDAYITRSPPLTRTPDAKMQSDIARVQHLHETLGSARLISNPSLQVKLSELALVTSWEEYRALLTPQLFYQNANFARDRCLLSTVGFTLLQS
eukprot:TRINITY_DN3752_c3_g1_i2.p1 TRINITY_DN3752_c3_g1~~TRINITY_DN3752_c3_g1_i2.p1  ORF type:complete len:4139 (+),score=668.66 TRINITY_DN3752_c3_g1_i2:80-12418(+)